MNLESDKRLNIQLRLDFSSAPTGEARQTLREDIESLSVRVAVWTGYAS
jgi:RNA-directed DNA polymerase